MRTELAGFLVEAGHRAPSADNNQPWHFQVERDRLTLRYDQTRCGTQGFGPNAHATLLAMGAVIENVLQAAEAARCEIAWDMAAGDFAESHYFQAQFDPAAVIPIEARQHPIFSRHTNRAPFRREPLADELQARISSMTESSAQVKLLTKPAEIRQMARITELASRARFQTREIHEWLGEALRFTQTDAERGDGLDVATLELPPGGGLLLQITKDWQRMASLNKLGAYKLFAAIEAAAIRKAPAMLVITGAEGATEALAAGRLMERVWLALEGKGVAVQPYYVVPDQLQRSRLGSVPHHLTAIVNHVSESVAELLGADDSLPHMILRVGYPKRDVIRSLRLPLESVCSEIK